MPPTAVLVLESKNQEADIIQNMISARKLGDWKSELGLMVQKDQLLLKGIYHGNTFTPESTDTIEERVTLNKLLYDNNIKPLESSEEMKGINFLYCTLNVLFPFLLAIIILLLSADTITGELEAGTFKFLLLQPISRRNILFAKLIACIVFCCVSLLGLLIVSFLCVSMMNGMGEINYPIACHFDRILRFTTMGQLLLSATAMNSLFLFFVACLAVFISVIAQNNAVSICISVIVAVLLNYLTSILKTFPLIYAGNPFSYSNSISVLNGSAGLNTLTGIISLFVWSTIFIIISSMVFRKKDIL